MLCARYYWNWWMWWELLENYILFETQCVKFSFADPFAMQWNSASYSDQLGHLFAHVIHLCSWMWHYCTAWSMMFLLKQHHPRQDIELLNSANFDKPVMSVWYASWSSADGCLAVLWNFLITFWHCHKNMTTILYCFVKTIFVHRQLLSK